MIHFFTTAKIENLDSWDPAEAPEKFSHGFGHAHLELFAELRLKGESVSHGPVAPCGTSCLVLSAKDPGLLRRQISRRNLGLVRKAALASSAVCMVRNDAPSYVRNPLFVSRTFVANPTMLPTIRRGKFTTIPLLPQKGMLHRDPSRGTRLESLALKCNSFNLPEWLSEDSSFFRDLSNLISLRIDLETDNPLRWPDFRDVDVVLVFHSGDESALSKRRKPKPPTKLINAWVAGCIPVVLSSPEYNTYAVDGFDSLVVHSPHQIFEALSQLIIDENLRCNLFRGVRNRMIEYHRDNLLEVWFRSFQDVPRISRASIWVWFLFNYPISLLGDLLRQLRSWVRAMKSL